MPCRFLYQRKSLKHLWKLTTPEILLNRLLFPRIRPYQTLKLCSYFPNVKFDQKYASFKRYHEDKEATTQSQPKKLKTESKASNSFTFKGNKVQYELSISLHDSVDGVIIKNISKGNLSAAISELESVKTLITKRNKLIRFANKSPRAGQALKSTNQISRRRILRMKRGFVQPKDGYWPRFARR